MLLDLLKQQPIESTSLPEESLAKLKTAKKEMEKGIVSGVWVFGSTFVVALIAIFVGRPILGLDASALLDAFIFGILTYGLFIKNRFSAWALLLLFAGEKLAQISSFGSGSSTSTPSYALYISIVIFIGFIYGATGVMAWHKILAEKKTSKIKRFELKQTLLLIGILILSFIIGVILVAAKDINANSATGADQQNQVAPSTQPKSFTFASNEDSFRTIFPTQPSRSEKTSDAGTVGMAKTTTYSSQKDGSNYFVFVYTYNDPGMSEDSPNFSVVGAMEGAINGMANADGAKLISSSKTTIGGRDAYRYEIEIKDERMDGLVIYKGNRLYNVAVNYLSKNGAPSDTESYLNSFELTN